MLSKLLSENKELKELNLSGIEISKKSQRVGNNLGDQGIIDIMNALQGNTTLTNLNLGGKIVTYRNYYCSQSFGNAWSDETCSMVKYYQIFRSTILRW